MGTAQTFLLVFLPLLPSQTASYNRPNCKAWPSKNDWEALASRVTELHGPFNKGSLDYLSNCYFKDQERVSLLKQGQGLCMSHHNCANEFCGVTEPLDLPAYTIEAHDVVHIQEALRFANEHDIGVSVKSSGHSFEGQSTSADSLMIWMRHFRQTNVIHDFTDSCGVTKTTFQVAGGQNFDDVFIRIKNDYHIASGTCQTVALGGGWLTGGGVSWTSRKYGYGVDNVLSMDVVLADGTLVTADACNDHSDLFWALRGGGGGNFGIVTQVEYVLHPPTKIVVLEFNYQSGSLFSKKKDREFARLWLDVLIRELPTLDQRWGGAWNPVGGRLMFTGSVEEARGSAFMAKLDDFYRSITHLKPNFGQPSSKLQEFDGFHDQNGGDDSHENPDYDSSARVEPTWYEDNFSRILPVDLLQEKPSDLRDLIVDMWFKKEFTHPQSYLFGGKTSEVGQFDTALHPAMRKGVMELRVRNQWGIERLQGLLDGYLWSVCYNHHSVNEENVKEACWGENYSRLQEIKARYDPGHRFNVYHGVSHRADVESANCPRKITRGFLAGAMFYTSFVPSAIGDWLGALFNLIMTAFTNLFR